MNIFKSSGIITGLLIGLVLVAFFFKFANTNHRTKTEYDERQREIRGRGYMYAFYTLLIYECVAFVLGFGEISIPVEQYLIHFLGILLGSMVLGCYSIWNEAYWGLNNNNRRYGIVFAGITVLNAIPVIAAICRGTLIQDGKPGSAFVNLLVLIMLAILGLTFLLKLLADRRKDREA